MVNYSGFLERNKAWDYMVADHVNNRNRDVAENKKIWNDFLCDPAFFGYSRIFKEVLSGRKVVVGDQEFSIPYFVVRDSVSEEDLFVLDVKKYDSVPDAKDVNQLKYCLRNFGVDYSVLICDKIYIYDRTNVRRDVPFVENNSDGIKFLTDFNYNQLSPNGPLAYPHTGMTKGRAMSIFSAKGYPLENDITTFTTRNSSSGRYWANPNVNLLRKNWYIIFNDTSIKTLYLALVPAFSISQSQVVRRPDRLWRIDLQIDGVDLIDTRSGVKLAGYVVDCEVYED